MDRCQRITRQAQQDRAHSLYEDITAWPSDRLQRAGTMFRTSEWPPSPFNAAATFVWVSRSEVSWNSPSRDPNQQIFCWPVTGTQRSNAGQNGTKDCRRALTKRPAILSPLPPCLAGHVGRSRYADRLRPDFFRTGPAPHASPKRTWPGQARPCAEQIDLWTLLRRGLALDRLPLAMAGFAAKE